jgi:alpha-tubulin suppressor-like RCC1 family protein
LLTDAGTAHCWGRNYYAQTGQLDLILAPATVDGVNGISAISGGYFRTCGLTTAGGTICWGDGLVTPTTFAEGRTFTAIEHGDAFTCGLDGAQNAWCWGANDLGKLGVGNESSYTTPQAVSGGHRFSKLSSFYTHSCGLDVAGAVWCWGANRLKQIDDSGVSRLVPTAITTTLRFTDISAASFHTCGVATDARMYCWGDLFSTGSVTTRSAQPAPFATEHRFQAVASGYNLVCGIRLDRTVVCFGAAWSAPTVIDGLTNVERIEGFSSNMCAITTERAVYCWGDNANGQLGDPSLITASWNRAIRIGSLSDAVRLGGAYFTPCAVRSSGTVSCWGFNANREAGQPLSRVPRPVTGGLTFKTS